MNENDFIHQDFQPAMPTQPQIPPEARQEMKSAMTKRTVAASLISASITFILTVSVLLYFFYSVYLPSSKANEASTIAFDSSEETKTAVAKLKTVIRDVRDNYLENLTDAQILEAMTIGFPSGLMNPYTYYMSSEEYTANREAMSGEYVGIGCTVTLTEDIGVVIIDVISGSPAEQAGLAPGDVIISVDGSDVRNAETSSDVAAKVKGPEGTTVAIEVYRPSTDKTLTLTIERKTIQSHNVISKMLDGKTGYVMVKSFAEGVPADFIAAMDSLQEQGAENIVFDLRNDSGGNAAVMIEMLDYLLPADTVLASIKGRQDGEAFEIDWKTQGGVKVPESMRYAILVNGYTASASEFFSGCLRDYGKAVLIGENTFGKGSGTKLYELSDGSAVNITTFKYYLPNGESIEGVGLAPDYEVSLDEAYQYVSIEKLTLEQDAQLQKALEVLNK